MRLDRKIFFYILIITLFLSLSTIVFFYFTHQDGAAGGIYLIKKYLFKVLNAKITLKLITSLIKIAFAVIITIIIAGWTSNKISKYIQLRQKDNNNPNVILATKLITIGLYIFISLVTVNSFGIDLKLLSVFSGAIGVGLGFGLQKTVSNFVSGLVILFEKSIQINDLIELPDGILGFVRRIRMRYTVLETYDGHEVLIPNDEIIINKLSNLTYSNHIVRCTIDIPLPYSTNIRIALKTIIETLENYNLRSKAKPVECFFKNFNDGTVILTGHFWIDNASEGTSTHRTNAAILIIEAFKNNNIVVSLPQREIHLKNHKI